MAGYDQDVSPDQQQQGADVSAQPQPARPPAVRWLGGPGEPHLIGNGEAVVAMLEVDGTPGSTVDVTGVVHLANTAWFATGHATIPPQGPGYATLVFTSLPSDLSMPGSLNPFTITAIDLASAQVSRQDTVMNVVNQPTAQNPTPQL